uniref:Asparagine synthetase n=1 Tax=Pyrus pyrifolia TaxID=3767 RepID=Q9LLJ8_PYRPY|nr:asparagine synthetase [Pyrus pyrifolia]
MSLPICMKSMGRISLICWTACFRLCCWIPATTASSLLAMLSESLPSISAGVLTARFGYHRN